MLELDGSQHYEEQGEAYDAKRTHTLEGCGLEVLRFSNRDLEENFRGVCKQIDTAVKRRIS